MDHFDIGVVIELLLSQKPVLGISCRQNLTQQCSIVGEELLWSNEGDLACESRLSKSLNTVHTSCATSNNDIMSFVIWVSLRQLSGLLLLLDSSFWNLNKEFSIFFNDLVDRDSVKTWGTFDSSGDHTEPSGVEGAEHLVIEQHSFGKRCSEVRTVSSDGMKLPLIS